MHVCVCYWEFLLEVCISSISWPTPTVSGRREKSSRIISTSWSRPCRRCEELSLAPSTRDDIYSAEPTPSLKPRRHANKGSSTSRRTSISPAFPKLTEHAHKSRHAEICTIAQFTHHNVRVLFQHFVVCEQLRARRDIYRIAERFKGQVFSGTRYNAEVGLATSLPESNGVTLGNNSRNRGTPSLHGLPAAILVVVHLESAHKRNRDKTLPGSKIFCHEEAVYVRLGSL